MDVAAVHARQRQRGVDDARLGECHAFSDGVLRVCGASLPPSLSPHPPSPPGARHPVQVIYYPMARAGARAMDATEDYLAKTTSGAISIKKWVVAGASKRGATTWLLGAACHARIVGIMPVVFDLLNFNGGIQHMWQALGGLTFAFVDYLNAGVPSFFGTPYMDRLAAAIDPIAFKENLTMSKLVADGTGDEFFAVQDDASWWGDLPGETLRAMIANAEHSMATGIPGGANYDCASLGVRARPVVLACSAACAAVAVRTRLSRSPRKARPHCRLRTRLRPALQSSSLRPRGGLQVSRRAPPRRASPGRFHRWTAASRSRPTRATAPRRWCSSW